MGLSAFLQLGKRQTWSLGWWSYFRKTLAFPEATLMGFGWRVPTTAILLLPRQDFWFLSVRKGHWPLLQTTEDQQQSSLPAVCVEENKIQNYFVWLWFSVNITVQLPQVIHSWSSEMSDSNVILTPEVWGTLYLHFLFQKSKKNQSQTWICIKLGGWIQKGQYENGQSTLLFPHSIRLGLCCFTSLQSRRPPLRYVMESAISN